MSAIEVQDVGFCPICHAMVWWERWDAHIEWHHLGQPAVLIEGEGPG